MKSVIKQIKMLENVYFATIQKPVENNEVVKIGKNQIFKDDSQEEFKYVVEKYEYNENETDMFSVHDSYSTLEEAVKVALKI